MSKHSNIHPLAFVEDGAKIGHNVTIEPFVVIKKDVVLGDNVVIKSNSYIDGHTTIGDNTIIYPSVSIGTKPQAIRYKGEKTFVKIGKNCEIREFVTINSSLKEGSEVVVGDNCFIMAYCHIAHNSILGNNVILSNNATLAGHVTVEDYAIIGGMTPIHQFVRVGRYAFVGGLSRVPCDVPPYTLGGGIPYKFGGLNLVGLKRHGFSLQTRSELSKAFKLLYRSNLRLEEALLLTENECKPIPEIVHWIKFCRESKRGLINLQSSQRGTDFDFEFLEENENAAV
jgi:UDP-N-acetylglucosamine acyltransferase